MAAFKSASVIAIEICFYNCMPSNSLQINFETNYNKFCGLIRLGVKDYVSVVFCEFEKRNTTLAKKALPNFNQYFKFLKGIENSLCLMNDSCNHLNRATVQITQQCIITKNKVLFHDGGL
ncbi:hypothetical protein T01_4570 [Trichinella spiralis]|uniref:Uncharacterized protein n=1 Tax=Trichinella spiralis TaxID=6334 RepID=A0A0V1BH53_TRISP|nr:hypothetical protein T01_4570 [Trichinella spiralis]